MAQWLRDRLLFQKVYGSILSTRVLPHSCLYLHFKGIQYLTSPLLTLNACEFTDTLIHRKKKKRDKCWKRGNIWFTLSMKIIFNILELPPYIFKVPSWFPNIALEQSSGQCCFYCENIKLVKIHTNHTNQKFGDMIQHVSVINSIVLDINDLSYL